MPQVWPEPAEICVYCTFGETVLWPYSLLTNAVWVDARQMMTTRTPFRTASAASSVALKSLCGRALMLCFFLTSVAHSLSVPPSLPLV